MGYGATVAALGAMLIVGCNTGNLISGGPGLPGPGEIVFNDPSPVPSDNVPDSATMVGSEICGACHGRSVAGHPDGLLAEWQLGIHAKDPTKLGSGSTNVFTRTVADGEFPGTNCGICHATGAPDSGAPLGSVHGGFDTSQAYDTAHNQKFWRVQCEACHGAGSAHIAAGGARNLINRVPNASQTCVKCHAINPNTKGHSPNGPATDGFIALYTSSIVRSHAAGVLALGRGGYEYPGITYQHSPHKNIANGCQTCHGLRLTNEPTRDHADFSPRKEACAFCHGGAANAPTLEQVVVSPEGETLEQIREEVSELLIQLGGATSGGAPDINAGGGALKAYLNAGGAATDPKYRRARWNFSIVINDASLGAHDYDYAKQLIETSIADLQQP